MNHPVLSALAAIEAALDEVAGVDPLFMDVPDKKAALTLGAKVTARLEALRMRLLATAGDVAIETGARSASVWLADETREAPGLLRRAATLAEALERHWTEVGAALAAGSVNTSQARVIVEALDALPADLPEGVAAKAEEFLVDKALTLGPRELRRLGAGVLEHLASEIADEAEYQRLLASERRAMAVTRLFFRPRGDGATDINARVPDHVAHRLRTFLDGYTSPRNKTLGDIDDLRLSQRRGLAFCAVLENLPASGLPRQGGSTTNVSVVIPLETLQRDLTEAGVAVTSTGDKITAGEARRLACQAGIIPFVMSGRSVIHDQGRKKRLFDEPIRLALTLLFPECTARGCSIPASWCEAHHKRPWSQGGRTRLEDGTLLCPFHHHLAHDPGWNVGYQPNGETTFTRRQ